MEGLKSSGAFANRAVPSTNILKIELNPLILTFKINKIHCFAAASLLFLLSFLVFKATALCTQNYYLLVSRINMGCVSSALLNQDDDFSQIGASSTFAHHIVSLQSTTYGLLTLDPPPTTTIPPTPPPRFTLPSDLRPLKPEIINSWELMAGLDSFTPPLPLAHHNRSFRFSPLPSKPSKENSDPNLQPLNKSPRDSLSLVSPTACTNSLYSLDGFEMLCPPNGENKVVIYTTTLRGIRMTFEACNAVRSAIQGLGVLFCERDISMDRGFREELRQLFKGKKDGEFVPPRVFVRGRYIGGAEEVMRIAEDEEGGGLGNLLRGLPKMRAGHVCEGCGGVRFLPCFQCNGSCKMVKTLVKKEAEALTPDPTVVVRCPDCNENGLVLCPICS